MESGAFIIIFANGLCNPEIYESKNRDENHGIFEEVEAQETETKDN